VSLEATALLEKMVSPVHLVCPEKKEKPATPVWTDSRAYQVQRETLATASQVCKVPRVTPDAMACREFKAPPDYREKTDYRDWKERREIPVCLDCRDRREKRDCLGSLELKVNRAETV